MGACGSRGLNSWTYSHHSVAEGKTNSKKILKSDVTTKKTSMAHRETKLLLLKPFFAVDILQVFNIDCI